MLNLLLERPFPHCPGREAEDMVKAIAKVNPDSRWTRKFTGNEIDGKCLDTCQFSLNGIPIFCVYPVSPCGNPLLGVWGNGFECIQDLRPSN